MCNNRLLLGIQRNRCSLKYLSYKAEWLLTHSEHLARMHRQIGLFKPVALVKHPFYLPFK
jgi:hypothetical protein